MPITITLKKKRETKGAWIYGNEGDVSPDLELRAVYIPKIFLLTNFGGSIPEAIECVLTTQEV